MQKNFAVALLALVFTANIATGLGHRIDRRVCTVESSLYDKLEDRACADLLVETERKLRCRLRPYRQG